MKIKKATFLAICGSAGMAIALGIDIILRGINISNESYIPIRQFLDFINIVGRILTMIFFIYLYKNQK